MPVYNVSAIIVDLVEADSPEEAQNKLVDHLRRSLDGDVSSPDEWDYIPGEPFESEPLGADIPVIR